MKKYRKKPVVVEAVYLTANNYPEVVLWCNEGLHPTSNAIAIWDGFCMRIRTLEGDMIAIFGDWIIKGINGEFYPCKPDIFEKTYDPV